MPCCTASSRVAATLAVAAKACEVIAGRLLQGLAGGTEAAVVAGSWKGAAAPAVAAEVCKLIASGFLQGLTRGAQAGVVAVVVRVRKRGEGWRRHRWRHFTTAAVEHFLCSNLHRHSSNGGRNKQIYGTARG